MSGTKTVVSESSQKTAHENVTQGTAPENDERGPERAPTRAERQAAREATRSEEQRDRQQRMQERSARELAQAAAVRQEEAFREEELALLREALEQNQRQLDQHLAQSAMGSSPPSSPFDRPVTIGAAEAEARYQAQMKRLSMLARADFFRAIALITVVVAIVATPIYAMAVNASPEAFAAYIAPVTGIAGAVVGYWFGASGQNKSSESANPAAGSTAPTADQ